MLLINTIKSYIIIIAVFTLALLLTGSQSVSASHEECPPGWTATAGPFAQDQRAQDTNNSWMEEYEEQGVFYPHSEQLLKYQLKNGGCPAGWECSIQKCDNAYPPSGQQFIDGLQDCKPSKDLSVQCVNAHTDPDWLIESNACFPCESEKNCQAQYPGNSYCKGTIITTDVLNHKGTIISTTDAFYENGFFPLWCSRPIYFTQCVYDPSEAESQESPLPAHLQVDESAGKPSQPTPKKKGFIGKRDLGIKKKPATRQRGPRSRRGR